MWGKRGSARGKRNLKEERVSASGGLGVHPWQAAQFYDVGALRQCIYQRLACFGKGGVFLSKM
jgi:hypothetical protein